jgi:hypothetical protein
MKAAILQSARHVCAHPANADETDVHKNEMTKDEGRRTKECRNPNDRSKGVDSEFVI